MTSRDNMTRIQLFEQIKKKRSFLCVGLDTDITKIPKHLLDAEDPVFEFNRQIIDATQEFCVAYKPNLAFYESLGASGWISLEKTLQYIPDNIFTIADAKRGDIGNTSLLYAKAFFEQMNFDAVTVVPYMGEDSVTPFLNFKSTATKSQEMAPHPFGEGQGGEANHWVILLALTSNMGATSFQMLETSSNQFLFEQVIETSKQWGTPDNMMYVVGATRTEQLQDIRKLIPDHFLLVPGVGAQGGSLQEVAKFGMNNQCGLLINSSRKIIYASGEKDFAQAASKAANEMQQEMEVLLKQKGIL